MELQEYLKTIHSERKKNFLRTAQEMEIKVELISDYFRVLRLTNNNKSKLLYKENFFLNKKPSTLFTKNKELTKVILRKNKLTVPKGVFSDNYRESLELLEKNKISYPVVIKPIDAAKGVGVSIGIRNTKEAKKAIKKVASSIKKNKLKSSGMFMIEETAEGGDFRVLVLKGRVIACVERVPAHIFGDGKSNIKKLIEDFNAKRPPAYIIKKDKDLIKKLKENKLNLKSTPKKGKKIILRDNANISSGGIAVDKTNDISKRFSDIAIRSASALGLNYAGIDIMTRDITSESEKDKYFIIEINGAPDYDIHERPVIQGPGVNVTKLLVKAFMNLD